MGQGRLKKSAAGEKRGGGVEVRPQKIAGERTSAKKALQTCSPDDFRKGGEEKERKRTTKKWDY